MYFATTKTPRSPTLSAVGREANYHLTRSDLWGEWKTLVFPPLVPDAFVTPINMISSIGTFVGDPWILPDLTEVETYGDTMPLSLAERTYSAIQSESAS